MVSDLSKVSKQRSNKRKDPNPSGLEPELLTTQDSVPPGPKSIFCPLHTQES